jgi:hypothetical protein
VELDLSIPSRVQELRTGLRRASLMALLSDYGSLKCADFHDRVYGLLSLAINGHRYPIDYESGELKYLFTTIEFCRMYGVYLTEETELFAVASTICTALSIDLESLTQSASSLSNIEDIECQVLLSSFETITTLDLCCRRHASLECQRCH